MNRRCRACVFAIGMGVASICGPVLQGQAPPAIEVTRFSQNPLVTVLRRSCYRRRET